MKSSRFDKLLSDATLSENERDTILGSEAFAILDQWVFSTLESTEHPGEQEQFFRNLFGSHYRPHSSVSKKMLKKYYAFLDLISQKTWYEKVPSPDRRKLGNLLKTDFSLTSLMYLDDTHKSYPLLKALLYLPFERLQEQFGDYILLWLFLGHRIINERYDELKDFLKSESLFLPPVVGFEMFERAKRALRRTIWDDSMFTIMRLYQLYAELPAFLADEGSQALISRSYKHQSEPMPAWYELKLILPKYPEWGKAQDRWDKQLWENVFDLFLDTPLAVSVFYQDAPLALVWFEFGKNNKLVIKQIQWIRPIVTSESRPKKKKRTWHALHKIEWKKLLKDTVLRIAQVYGFEDVVIQSAQNNGRTKPYHVDGNVHLPEEKAIKIYDDFALAEWFIFEEKDNNYHLKIEK